MSTFLDRSFCRDKTAGVQCIDYQLYIKTACRYWGARGFGKLLRGNGLSARLVSRVA